MAKPQTILGCCTDPEEYNRKQVGPGLMSLLVKFAQVFFLKCGSFSLPSLKTRGAKKYAACSLSPQADVSPCMILAIKGNSLSLWRDFEVQQRYFFFELILV